MRGVKLKTRREPGKLMPAEAAGRVKIEDCRCAMKGHGQRIASTTSMRMPLCWECYLGIERFKEKFGAQAEGFYQPGGPGWAGD